MKGIKAGFAAMLSILLVWGLCACSSQDPSHRKVEILTPLKEPHYVSASLDSFSLSSVFGKKYDFIFKGRIDKVSDVLVSFESVDSLNEKETVDEWFSSCDVTIDTIFFGEIPGIKNKIKVVFGGSSRGTIENSVKLIEGEEYYFITHVFTEADKAYEYLVREYEFGDVRGSNIYNLLPVNDGVVSFRNVWPFSGSKQVDSSNVSSNSFEVVAATIDEKSFLTQFIAMIQTAKATSAPQPTTTVVD